MNVGIELFANGQNRLDAQRFEHAIELFVDQIDAAEEMTKLVRFARFDRSFCFQRSFQIVEHRQQLRGDFGNDAL